MSVPKVRYIKPETVHIGDTIRVTTKHEDLTIERVGTVAAREHQGAATVLYTESGAEIARYIRENSRSFTVTLLEASPSRNAAIVPLFTL